MPGETLLPPVVAGGPSACTLVHQGNLYDPVKLVYDPRRAPSKLGVGGAAPIAFATDVTDDFADLAWLDDEGEELVGGDDAQAELLRLESVFGNTTCAAGSDSPAEEDDDLLLLDGDLQDALLALPDLDLGLDPLKPRDDLEKSAKIEACFDIGNSGNTADCRTSCSDDSCGGSTTDDCSGGSETIVGCGVSDTTTETPLPLTPSTDLLVDFNAAASAASAADARATPDGNSVGTAIVQADGASSGKGEGHDIGPAPQQAALLPTDEVADPSTTTANAAAAASPPANAVVGASGVPTRLLDAIELWESANAHAKARKKASAKLAARERRAASRAAAGGGGGGVASTRSTSKKGDAAAKKKNEFGKRRRSSGGGGSALPVIPPVADEVEPPTSAAAAAGKAKGKKVDPLVAVREARRLSRKPLIVQWLKSDGCDSDAEAEAALGKAVGSLSAISRYWGGGG